MCHSIEFRVNFISVVVRMAKLHEVKPSAIV